MWFSTPSVESLTRPRLAVAIVSAAAAISVGYYAYQYQPPRFVQGLPPGNLHRSNALRRSRASRRSLSRSSSFSDIPADENAENLDSSALQPLGDAETLPDDDDNAVGAADEWWNDPGALPPQRAGHNIVNLLFRVSEDNARRNGCVHRGCQCNSCGMVPIRGIRYRCANCPDFDLCETCESQGVHTKTHIFYKIRIPVPPFGRRQMQPVWYTGDPESCRRAVPRGIMAKLSRETGFERPELEAFWEQWTFMANTEWRDDPDQFCVAMDRKTFERCLVPTGGSGHSAPNLIHDRMFAFYDSNNDDLIGFSEFLHGLSYRKRKDKLQTVFDGYDIDGDGLVNRRDFLRMFRAYYVLYKQMHKDILNALEDSLMASTEAQQLVAGRQPLSSLFGRDEHVPPADRNMRFEGKSHRGDGHVDVDGDKSSTYINNENDVASRGDILTSLFACETDRRSRRRFVTGNDEDNNWRTVRRVSGADTDRTYWVTLLEPPRTLDELPGMLMGNTTLGNGESEAIEDEAHNTHDQDENDEGNGQPNASESSDYRHLTESEVRARTIKRSRSEAPKLEKKRRDMARKKIHDRWRRRQFYLDEEEGGVPPDDWSEDEDILVKSSKVDQIAETYTSGEYQNGLDSATEYSDSSDDSDDERSHSRKKSRFNGLPDAERDAGKEILYQVTQQAFNELLDVIFKQAEDAAIEAAETKWERAQFASAIEAIDLNDETDEVGSKPLEREFSFQQEKPVEDKSLQELLEDTGYHVAADAEADETTEPRKAVELVNGADLSEITNDTVEKEEPASTDYRDPTLPQFRPDSEASFSAFVSSGEFAEKRETAAVADPEPPSKETLRRWKRLGIAEATAKDRGGWGKLNFEEFETIYQRQENQGNRLDYLGSWIDFCIP
ncbi:hypothetical protein K4F52_004095 [Lecanicillium sp. MT-2017a]|nr:hypothetical protein K4F52_004095 [Lecanicillium sp. MT-2017a]